MVNISGFIDGINHLQSRIMVELQDVCTGREDVEEMQVTDIDLSKADWVHKLENYIGELV